MINTNIFKNLLQETRRQRAPKTPYHFLRYLNVTMKYITLNPFKTRILNCTSKFSLKNTTFYFWKDDFEFRPLSLLT